jgi:hypothetical protein
MIDGDDVLLKNQMQNIFKEELVNQDTSFFSRKCKIPNREIRKSTSKP